MKAFSFAEAALTTSIFPRFLLDTGRVWGLMTCRSCVLRYPWRCVTTRARRADDTMALLIFNLLAIVIVVLALAALGMFGPAILRWALAAIRTAFRS